MKEIEESLHAIGLTHTEAKIYLAGLGVVSTNIQELAQKTGIKRPTIYHSINTLIEKGLVAENKVANKLRFSMAAPVYIKEVIKDKRRVLDAEEKRLDSLIPLLTQRQKTPGGNNVQSVHYHGVEGVKMVLDMAFYCKGKHWDIIAPVNNFLRSLDKDYRDYYLNARRYYSIQSRTLWEKRRDGRKLTAEEIKARNPRYMPESMRGKFESMAIFFDDKVALFSGAEPLSAILITSKEFSRMFATLFEAIWHISEPYQ